MALDAAARQPHTDPAGRSDGSAGAGERDRACTLRWLGIDPGEARVGIAACDPKERVAVPLEIVPAAAAFPAIRSIASREEVGGIVIGLAVSLDGVQRE